MDQRRVVWPSTQRNQLLEWKEAMRKTADNSAPGISGIGYTLLRRIGPKTKAYILKLLNKILKEGIYPRKWKIGMIFLIPKIAEWDLTMQKMRPIMLLEAARKCFVRIMQRRLSKAIVKKQILKGLNFAGLPGESTQEPLHIINNLIEGAREKDTELWIVLLDIKKAFNSVSLEGLKAAMKRISFPTQLIHLMLELFDDREIKIITKFGLTESIRVKEDIDQGEVISPLLWRIYFDPLLSYLRESRLGAKIEVEWPADLRKDQVRKDRITVAGLAYADDTVLVAESQEKIQEIIDIAEEFFEANSIELNTKKTELIVFNKKGKKNSSCLLFNKRKDKVIPKKDWDLTRFLGVWIAVKGCKKSLKSRLKREAVELAHLIKTKEISIDQARYINNKVLLPRLEYKLNLTLLNKQECDKIQNPMLQVVK